MTPDERRRFRETFLVERVLNAVRSCLVIRDHCMRARRTQERAATHTGNLQRRYT